MIYKNMIEGLVPLEFALIIPHMIFLIYTNLFLFRNGTIRPCWKRECSLFNVRENLKEDWNNIRSYTHCMAENYLTVGWAYTCLVVTFFSLCFDIHKGYLLISLFFPMYVSSLYFHEQTQTISIMISSLILIGFMALLLFAIVILCIILLVSLLVIFV